MAIRIPLWQMTVLLVYSPKASPLSELRRQGGASALGEMASMLQRLSTDGFSPRGARRLSWKEVANVFGTSWDTVYRCLDYTVRWGLVHRVISGVTAIGVDEIQVHRGHKYRHACL